MQPRTVSGLDWTDCVAVSATGATQHCICEELEVGALVLAWGCPLHAEELYTSYLRSVVATGGLASDIAKARLADLAEYRRRWPSEP